VTRPRAIRGEDVRRALAQEAARIMVEHGIDDYLFAKRKAADRLGVGEHAAMPKNSEVEAALIEYQRLFAADSHADILAAQRRAALWAMALLEEFDPRLVGPVLTGTSTPHQGIDLHLFSDSAEAVSIKLLERGIPYRVAERRVRMNQERVLQVPALSFESLEHEIEATVFPVDGIRQAPLSPTDGRPMHRAAREELEELLEVEALSDS
jgi:hypothetical protein